MFLLDLLDLLSYHVIGKKCFQLCFHETRCGNVCSCEIRSTPEVTPFGRYLYAVFHHFVSKIKGKDRTSEDSKLHFFLIKGDRKVEINGEYSLCFESSVDCFPAVPGKLAIMF